MGSTGREWVANPAFVDTNIPQIRKEIAKVTEDDKQHRTEAWGQIDQIMNDAKTSGFTKKYKSPISDS